MNSLINEKNPSFTFSLCAKTLLKSVICDVTKGATIQGRFLLRVTELTLLLEAAKSGLKTLFFFRQLLASGGSTGDPG